ncbi:MAG TPA: AraC family transcriptional regulator [Saprospiraceae bacterium]|nr:AraC family transcriptional regulator [Saprospiraceae bacterium]
MESASLWSSMAFVRNVALAAVRKGIDWPVLAAEIGVPAEVLQKAEGRATIEQCIAVWEVAIRHTGDPLLGLHLGETTTPGVAGMVGYLAESSPDLLTAFQNGQQFHRALTNATQYDIQLSGDEFRYFIEPVPLWYSLSAEAARQIVEHSLSAFMHMIKLLSGKTLFPLRILLRHPRPLDTRPYGQVLKTEPLFGQECNCIVFRLHDMQYPVLGHNPALNRLFRELLEQELAKTAREVSFSGEVRRVILQNFSTALPQVNEVAEYLNTSPRTLQRKLKEEGASFQSISESVKSELALGLLKNRSLTVNEIAYKLGYAEPSIFRRAFKKWTGASPKSFGAQA